MEKGDFFSGLLVLHYNDDKCYGINVRCIMMRLLYLYMWIIIINRMLVFFDGNKT
jgi:hypothetical protein